MADESHAAAEQECEAGPEAAVEREEHVQWQMGLLGIQRMERIPLEFVREVAAKDWEGYRRKGEISKNKYVARFERGWVKERDAARAAAAAGGAEFLGAWGSRDQRGLPPFRWVPKANLPASITTAAAAPVTVPVTATAQPAIAVAQPVTAVVQPATTAAQPATAATPASAVSRSGGLPAPAATQSQKAKNVAAAKSPAVPATAPATPAVTNFTAAATRGQWRDAKRENKDVAGESESPVVEVDEDEEALRQLLEAAALLGEDMSPRMS